MQVKSVHGTLVADTVTTISDIGTGIADVEQVDVLNRDGTAEIYFTVDGTDPTVEGDNTEVLPAAIGALSVPVETTAKPTVKLISSGTPKYSVRVSWPGQ